MKRAATEENGDAKRSYGVKQEGMPYGYDTYVSYASTTSTPTSVNQPLPGQPPLPPMPPPPGSVPPPPHVFLPSQVTPIQTWAHAPPHWQWLTQQATTLSSQPATNFQRDLSLRGNFVRRERFNSNRNNVYQRNNFHRNKNRRNPRYESVHGQLDQSYFGTALQGNIALDWQRNNFPTTGSEGIMGHIPVNIPNQMNHLNSAIPNRRPDDDPDIKVISEEVMVKKNKQRKPMSQSYPSRPWNRDDAVRALQTESEYNKTVKAQSLIIKFPDPDLNKEIVRALHPGIQNIHFQSPSGPRYCFIQMANNVDIDEAIKELEKVAFGVGHLKVERKSLRDDDNPMPEEIDPYTLYIGNLPESVNVNEVKSKFPSAARVDVGYAQKMRNTRYAFIRYNNVEESIAAYQKAHDLMWDTRSIIVRFRRQRGNTCLPGEPRSAKKVKEEAVKSENPAKEAQNTRDVNKRLQGKAESESKDPRLNKSPLTPSPSSSDPSLTSPEKNVQNGIPELNVTTTTPNCEEKEDVLLTQIKEEPQDYEDLDLQMDDDDDDDDDEEEEIEEDEEEEEELDDDDDDDEEEEINETLVSKRQERLEDDLPSDHLDKMFNDLENIAGDISL